MPAKSPVLRAKKTAAKPNLLVCAALETQLGWMALQFQGDLLSALRFGYEDEESALDALPKASPFDELNESQHEIQQRLVAFAAGQPVDLSVIEVLAQWETPFALRVVEACRHIPYGETLSYQEVSAIAGSPAAARAVGNIMSSNSIPLVIPCHRVIGSHGALGGYSARGGLAVKRHLLDLEARQR